MEDSWMNFEMFQRIFIILIFLLKIMGIILPRYLLISPFLGSPTFFFYLKNVLEFSKN